MESAFRIELGAEAIIGYCDSCGHETRTFRGFVFNHEDAYAVYLCTYTSSHPEWGVAMTVSLRGWGDGTNSAAKECVALEWRNGDSGPGCRVIDASETSWASNSGLGQMLSREQALASGRASEALSVTDAVWAEDERLSRALRETQSEFFPLARGQAVCDQTEAQTEEELTNCINDLFLNQEYLGWRRELKSFSEDSWHLLIECLASCNAPADEFLAFGPGIYSKLVFSYTEAPDYAESQMLMVQFTVSGSMWNCLVWHCPERNDQKVDQKVTTKR